MSNIFFFLKKKSLRCQVVTYHYGMSAQITVNYWSLHEYSPSCQIMSLVKFVIITSSNGQKSILLEGNRLKKNFHGIKSMMKPLGLEY